MIYEDFKDIDEMSAFLSEQMKKVSKGEMTPNELSSISQAAGKCMYNIKLKLEYYDKRDEIPEIPFLSSKKMKKRHNSVKTEK